MLIASLGGSPSVYAPGGALGLDLAGFGTDDLDALALLDDRDGVYTPFPDILISSVRRGAIIGTPDSTQGLPIEPGDLLADPVALVLVLGLPLLPRGTAPGIVLASENLGLAAFRNGDVGDPTLADDVDAPDNLIVPEPRLAALLLLALTALGARRLAGPALRRYGQSR